MKELRRRLHQAKKELRLWRTRLATYRQYKNPNKADSALRNIDSLRHEIHTIQQLMEPRNGD